MTYLSLRLTGGVQLILMSVVTYFTSAVLLGIAVVPAALRSYQLYSKDDNGLLELLVELLRVVLILAMIAIGRRWNATSLLAGHEWRRVGEDIGHAVRTGWPAIVLELTLVTLVALAFNVVLAAVVNDRTVALFVATHRDSAQAADAITFAIKNVVVIPLFLMATLHSIRAMPPT